MSAPTDLPADSLSELAQWVNSGDFDQRFPREVVTTWSDMRLRIDGGYYRRLAQHGDPIALWTTGVIDAEVWRRINTGHSVPQPQPWRDQP